MDFIIPPLKYKGPALIIDHLSIRACAQKRRRKESVNLWRLNNPRLYKIVGNLLKKGVVEKQINRVFFDLTF
jgi:hypothetical protein